MPESHEAVRPRHRISPQGYLLGWAMSLSIRPIASLGTDSPRAMLAIRRIFRLTGAVLARTPDDVHVTPVKTPQVRGEWVCAPQATSARQVMLYLHGGGYFFGSASMHRQITWRMSRELRRPVLAIDYRLAPRHSFEHWRDDAVQAYEFLLARGYASQDIIVGGDSAGGHLTLVLLQTLRDRGLPLPRCGICISPWTDLSDESASRRTNAWRDPMIPARAVKLLAAHLARNRSPYDPLVSPLHGEFHDLPPLYVLVGSTEVLRDDARRMAMRAHESGVSVHYEEWHRMPHVFPIFAAVLPEGRSAFRHAARFVFALERSALALAA